MAQIRVRRLVASLLFVMACPGPMVGCSSAGADDLTNPGPVGDAAPQARIEFEPATTLTLMPSESRELTVRVTPAGVYTVKFALLSSQDSNPSDAVLDHDETQTDDDGVAHVTLTASSGPTEFSLRAAAGDLMSTLPVSVSATGTVPLEVRPVYSGSRAIETWTATVVPDVTCAELSDDATSGLSAEGAFPSRISVEYVPVGTVLAIIARAGNYVEGCTTVNEVVEGEDNRVLVPMTDRPIQLADSELELSLSFEMVSAEWEAAINEVVEDTKIAMLNGAGDDLEALLDAMQEALPEEQALDFAAQRSMYGWDAALEAAFAPTGGEVLRNAAARWMLAGQVALYEPGAINAHIAPDPSEVEEAELTLRSVAGFEPAEAGFFESLAGSWSADSEDTVLIAASLSWSPSELLGALAIAPAKSEHEDAETVAEALVLELDCILVRETLKANSCSTCTAALCRAGVERMWERARMASTEEGPAVLELSASGYAEVGQNAEVVELSGAWVGRYSSADEAATAGGPLEGSRPN